MRDAATYIVIPAQAGIQGFFMSSQASHWTPAFAGVTEFSNSL
jgi:hypothetical protein